MLNLILAESALERIPKPLWNHPSVFKMAERLSKQPGQLLLDRSFHHRAMLDLKEAYKRGRPDIVHFCLLEALGTPLNREYLLKTYIHTMDGHIIIPNPDVRLPRNYDRFTGLLEQLYDSQRIINNGKTLLELKRGNLSNLMDEVKPSYTLAFTRIGKPMLLHQTMNRLAKEENPVIIIGAFPNGNFSEETKQISNELICIDQAPLEAWTVVSRAIYDYELNTNLPQKRIGRTDIK
ncbi:MAG: rRNA small subunit pseudouridine methyltransferase Nep1 [Thermoproteota archaeon]|nr:rRNA small subunit pseudouridine methyltransferase Nep1 [Thermoproteota archaeon]